MYRIKEFFGKIELFLFRVISAFSFLAVLLSCGYIVYYVIYFDFYRAIVGCATLCTMAFINRSIQ